MKLIPRLLCLFVLFAALFYSCKKKDKDDNAEPSVTITKPSSGEVFSPLDTMVIEAHITDDNPLTGVTIRLLNSSYSPADHTESVPLSGTSYHLRYLYIIQNEYLETGNYYVTLTLSDGTHTHNEYRTIRINEIPRTKQNVFVITRPAGTHVNVSDMNASGVLTFRFQAAGDFSASAVNSRDRRLITLGKQTGNFTLYDVLTGTSVYTLAPYTTGITAFQNLCLYNRTAYVSFDDGKINGYNKDGQPVFGIQLSFYVPDVLCANDVYIFAEAMLGVQNRIVLMYKTSGAVKQECNIAQDVVSMLNLDASKVILFGNEAGNGKIAVYDVSSNLVSVLRTLAGVTIYKAAAVDADTFLLATNTGLHYYIRSNNNFLPLDASEPAYVVEYDDISGIVYSGSGKKIKQYEFPFAPVLNTTVTPDSVVDIKVLYSK